MPTTRLVKPETGPVAKPRISPARRTGERVSFARRTTSNRPTRTRPFWFPASTSHSSQTRFPEGKWPASAHVTPRRGVRPPMPVITTALADAHRIAQKRKCQDGRGGAKKRLSARQGKASYRLRCLVLAWRSIAQSRQPSSQLTGLRHPGPALCGTILPGDVARSGVESKAKSNV